MDGNRFVRLARAEDLAALLALYDHLNPERPQLAPEAAAGIWASILARDGMSVFLAETADGIAAACTLITAPNLMRGGRPHAFIENVVCHAAYRRRGHGRAVLQAALDAAWAQDCYQVMLLTGRKDPDIRAFYAGCGFEPDLKLGYVARCPA